MARDIVLILRPLPLDDWPAEQRLKQALKALLRKYRLRCVAGAQDDHQAWVGWRQVDGGWLRTCCGCTPSVVLELLGEEPGVVAVVLPRGTEPHGGERS